MNTHTVSQEQKDLINDFVDKDELFLRGWFSSSIQEFMPERDKILPNSLDVMAEPCDYYLRTRVNALEQDPFFKDYQDQILQKAAQNLLTMGIAHEALIRYASYELELGNPLLPIDQFELRVKAEISKRLALAAISPQSLDPSLLITSTLAVWVQMRELESELWKLETYFFHPSFVQAKHIVLHRQLDSIYQEHPHLLKGCEYFALDHDFGFNPNGFDAAG